MQRKQSQLIIKQLAELNGLTTEEIYNIIAIQFQFVHEVMVTAEPLAGKFKNIMLPAFGKFATFPRNKFAIAKLNKNIAAKKAREKLAEAETILIEDVKEDTNGVINNSE